MQSSTQKYRIPLKLQNEIKKNIVALMHENVSFRENRQKYSL